MSRVQSPDASFQLDEGTALQRLQNGLELGLSISKPTASARSAEILEAINKMELTFPMLTSEGAEDRVDTLVNTILKAVGDLPVGRRKSPGWLKESLIPLCTNCIQKGYLTFAAEQMERIQAEAAIPVCALARRRLPGSHAMPGIRGGETVWREAVRPAWMAGVRLQILSAAVNQRNIAFPCDCPAGTSLHPLLSTGRPLLSLSCLQSAPPAPSPSLLP